MEFEALLRHRLSVRSYEPRPVEPEKVRAILEAADMAPSAGNLQAYEIVCVTDPETRQALAKAPWRGPRGPASWFTNGQSVSAGLQSGRWVQYRLALGATNGMSTPRVSEVRVEYGP